MLNNVPAQYGLERGVLNSYFWMQSWFDSQWRRNFRPVYGISANPVTGGIWIATDCSDNAGLEMAGESDMLTTRHLCLLTSGHEADVGWQFLTLNELFRQGIIITAVM